VSPTREFRSQNGRQPRREYCGLGCLPAMWHRVTPAAGGAGRRWIQRAWRGFFPPPVCRTGFCVKASALGESGPEFCRTRDEMGRRNRTPKTSVRQPTGRRVLKRRVTHTIHSAAGPVLSGESPAEILADGRGRRRRHPLRRGNHRRRYAGRQNSREPAKEIVRGRSR